MKHNLLKSVIISVILLMGVSNVWGGNDIAFQSGAFFYFDPYYSTTQTVNKGYIQLAARKYQNSGQDDYGWYTAVTTLTKIANTRLYYTSTFEGPAWTDHGLKFHGWAMISNSSAKANGTTEYWTGSNSTWYSEFKNYGLNKNSTYLFVATSASNGQSIQPNGTGYLSGGYSALNSTQTIKTAVNGVDANSKATITVTSYRLTGDGTISAQQSASISTSAKSTTISAARTATTKLSVGTVATGYQFDGWYTTGGTKLSASTTYTYYPTEATTVYARFSEITYSVQVKSADNNQGTVSRPSVNAGQFTGVAINANPNAGYSFVNWTATAGISIADANSASTTIKATKEGTVTANFKELPANRIYFKPNDNWKQSNARFEALAINNGTSTSEWIILDAVGCGDYYTYDVPAKYNQILFARMNPAKGGKSFDYGNGVIWNQTVDLDIQKNKCFVLGEDQWGNSEIKATGTWDTYTSTITLTLKSSSNGKYHIIHKGSRYESSLTEDVNIDLPLNAEIIISDVADARPGYTFKKRYIKIGTNAKEEAATNTPYQLCGSTSITADFVTVIPHTVYFKPNANWKQDNARFAVYVYDEVGNDKWYNMTSATGGYYTCTIETGWSKLIFVRMNPANNTNKFEEDYSWNQTYSHAIPVNRFNTYVLYDGKWGADDNEGYWTHTPTFTNSYRLRYAEQVIEEADGWKTVINETSDSHHPEDVLPQQANRRDTISLFINTAGVNPEVILEQYNGTTWEVKERRMVNGPLETNNAGLAMLPGRRNAPGELTYDNGIDAITESGVWNFIIVQDGSGNATIKVDETHLYTGDYYIRTNNTAGGWNTYTHLDNHMKLSTNAESGYTHYYCKWVDVSTSDNAKNVKYIVANDYSINVSKELAKDIYTANDGDLVENANVRWTWNDKTGAVARAYIQGAFDPSTHNRLNNIVLDYTIDGTTDADDETLDDSGDWIYTKDVTVRSGATLVDLIAQYPSKTISEVSPQTQNFITGPITILEGMSNEDYTVRVTYDFKNNKATTFLLPGTANVATAVDVMIERVDQENTKAVQSTITATENHQFTVCGVMSFTKTHLANNELHNDLRQFYWISFPFNVNLEDVYGFGVYGKHWILETYNGERRAQDGLWLDSPSFWEYILDPKGVTLEANKGYLLCLDSELLSGTSDVFTNTNKVSLYFPATTPTTSINQDYITEVEIPSHVREDQRANRHIYDSNWNLIGVPSYANHTQTTNTENLQYFYDYQYDDQTGKMIYAPKSTTNSANEFQSMYAYFVQWGGTLNWSTFTGTDKTPRELAAKQNAAYEAQEHNLRLELQQDYKALDQTFVDMQEDGVTAAFDLNKDMTKILNAGANIYTLAGEENIQLAGNSLPIANTTIPVGVQIAKAGEYTFAMPDGTDGITVELIDYETNTTTNLLLSEYNVSLPAGTFENRFALIVKPNKVATDMETIDDETNGVKKYIIDGKLFLQKDGMLYDAQGHIVR